MQSLIGRFIRYTLLSPLFAICSTTYAESQSITVSDPRPVAKAVAKLEAMYGWPITYEDPPYVHKSEMVDVAAWQRRDQQRVRAPGKQALIPRGGTFSFQFDNNAGPAAPGMAAPASTALTPGEAIWGMLGSYNAALGGAEMFNLIEGDGVSHVVPSRFIDLSGRRERITPLLDVTVSVLPKKRSAADLVTEICDSLSLATGQTIIVGTTPWSQLARHTTTITATHETARFVLSRLLAEQPVPLSWRLLFDPGLQWYALNIHAVGTLANY